MIKAKIYSLLLVFLIGYGCQTTSDITNRFKNFLPIDLVDLDLEKENADNEDSKESELKFFTNDSKGINDLLNLKISSLNEFNDFNNSFISSGYTLSIKSPPEFI